MMKAYSTELREKALRHFASGLTQEEVAKKFGISKQTITKWKKQLFTTGNLERKYAENMPRKPYKYTPEKIKEFLEKSKISKDLESAKSSNVEENNKTTDMKSLLIKK